MIGLILLLLLIYLRWWLHDGPGRWVGVRPPANVIWIRDATVMCQRCLRRFVWLKNGITCSRCRAEEKRRRG